MEQPWIHKSKTDGIFILFPTFFVLGLVLICHDWLQQIEVKYSFVSWLVLIVFVDVAHVYATLFKTYFVKEEFQKRKLLYLGLPILCFVIGLFLFLLGSTVFWSVLAYIAVFHFIRQQFGFMRLYSRNELKTKFSTFFDKVVIYAVTVYPMLFWFFSPKRNFNWFMENEFFTFENHVILQVLKVVYIIVVITYIIRTLHVSIQNKFFNIPKNAVIVGTALSWYFGIVYYNNDLIFTLLNVVSHGIPYMALIYITQVEQKSSGTVKSTWILKHYKKIFVFIGILMLIAFTEEYLWEILVWNDHFSVQNFDFSNWAFVLVPLLSVPQFTHYILDGIIWKTKKKSCQ